MYGDQFLKTHLEESSTVEVESLIYAEINMNDATNINVIGNYRNRPIPTAEAIENNFTIETESTENPKYYGYTDADVVVDGSYLEDDLPASFTSINEKQQLLYSLEECFGKFRPRSGINKASFFPGHYSHNVNSKMMSRPRYYISSKDDKFKYWTSFRTEQVGTNTFTTERGVATYKVADKNQWYIEDTAPFIVYKNAVPINRIIVKMQTNVGTETIGNISDGNQTIPDPLYDPEFLIVNRTVPITWKIQYLHPTTNVWTNVLEFDEDDNAIIPLINRDGYLELQYSNGNWSVAPNAVDVQSPLFTDFLNSSSNQIMNIKGLRIVVNTMSKPDCTFDLIELSPRLAMNISSMTTGYSINKVASDLGVSGMPVGQLLASTGSIDIADYDEVLNVNNPNSVIAPYIKKNVQIKFYEIIKDVAAPNEIEPNLTLNYYVPIKTMYAESFPDINSKDRTASISLRDFYFHLESLTAPEMLIKDASFSYAVASLFDSIGFSNYIYLKSSVDDEPRIPYFYVAPNTTIAETLQSLAVSTQTAMFFDEYNNLVLMSKSYMLASPGERNAESPSSEVSLVLRGNSDGTKLANIIDLSSKDNNVFNDGKITYTTRYIQKDIKEVRLANLTDKDRVFVYRKALLWEVTADPTTKSQNEETGTQSGYSLTAIPLNANLAAVHPTVVAGAIVNNTLDLGEAIYFMPRYNGYLYSNGEIIRFDAIEYSVSQPFDTGPITPTTSVVATITNAVGNGSEITYTAANNFSPGDIVTITGITPTSLNLENVEVTESTTSNFKVESTVTATRVSGGIATKYVTDNIDAGSFTVNLEADNATDLGLKVGQRLVKISGVGVFGDGAKIASIATNQKSFTTTVAHASTGTIEFAAGIGESTKWITNVEDYQKYFAEVPFNGKMYPTGRVRIFAEPEYVNDTTLKNGKVARSGRAQFNTELTDHRVGLPSWVKGTGEQISGIDMESKYIFKDVYKSQFKLTVTNSSATNTKTLKIQTADRKNIRVGQRVSGNGVPSGTKVVKIISQGLVVNKTIGNVPGSVKVTGVKIYPSSQISTGPGAAGFGDAAVNKETSKQIASKSERSETIKNYLGTPEAYSTESDVASPSSASRIKSSALSFTGPTFPTTVPPIDMISYVYNELDKPYKHFGTRMRFIGLNENNEDFYQSPTGAMPYLSVNTKDAKTPTIINGGSGGIGIFTDPLTNNGYFFELAALTVDNVEQYTDSDNIANMFFYKVLKDTTKNEKAKAIPVVLWSGRTSINVDDGRFAGEYRVKGETNPTVYDLGVEYKETDGDITFYLYVNNKLVATVVDSNPLQQKPNISLFVRGTSKCMFENVFALGANQSSNYANPYEPPTRGFVNFEKEKNFDPAISRYTLPKIIEDSYLKGISPISTRTADVYFEEFGSMMREMAYFNIKYDKAYPAFISQILPTFNSLRGYVIGGFCSTAYGAEFLIFNTTDTVRELSQETGNSLAIGGVTFTQQAQHEYTVDEYFQEKTNMSNSTTYGTVINSPVSNKANYQNIKNSRIDYGRNEFNINAEYVQSSDGAESLMSWVVNKIMGPRKSVGIEIFANPAIALGDIVTIDYQSGDSSVDAVTDAETRFVIYNINYSRSVDGPSMTVYGSQIPKISGGS